MLPKDREAFLNYSYKASGWLIVAAGALLLALNETWSLGEAFHLSSGFRIMLMIVCSLASLLYTVSNLVRRRKILAE